MYDLEVGYRNIAYFRRSWIDKVVAVNAEKMAALEQLQVVTEREAKLQKEVFRLSVVLQSSGAELESAHQSILSLKSQIKSKKYSIH